MDYARLEPCTSFALEVPLIVELLAQCTPLKHTMECEADTCEMYSLCSAANAWQQRATIEAACQDRTLYKQKCARELVVLWNDHKRFAPLLPKNSRHRDTYAGLTEVLVGIFVASDISSSAESTRDSRRAAGIEDIFVLGDDNELPTTVEELKAIVFQANLALRVFFSNGRRVFIDVKSQPRFSVLIISILVQTWGMSFCEACTCAGQLTADIMPEARLRSEEMRVLHEVLEEGENANKRSGGLAFMRYVQEYLRPTISLDVTCFSQAIFTRHLNIAHILRKYTEPLPPLPSEECNRLLLQALDWVTVPAMASFSLNNICCGRWWALIMTSLQCDLKSKLLLENFAINFNGIHEWSLNVPACPPGTIATELEEASAVPDILAVCVDAKCADFVVERRITAKSKVYSLWGVLLDDAAYFLGPSGDRLHRVNPLTTIFGHAGSLPTGPIPARLLLYTAVEFRPVAPKTAITERHNLNTAALASKPKKQKTKSAHEIAVWGISDSKITTKGFWGATSLKDPAFCIFHFCFDAESKTIKLLHHICKKHLKNRTGSTPELESKTFMIALNPAAQNQTERFTFMWEDAALSSYNLDTTTSPPTLYVIAKTFSQVVNLPKTVPLYKMGHAVFTDRLVLAKVVSPTGEIRSFGVWVVNIRDDILHVFLDTEEFVRKNFATSHAPTSFYVWEEIGMGRIRPFEPSIMQLPTCPTLIFQLYPFAPNTIRKDKIGVSFRPIPMASKVLEGIGAKQVFEPPRVPEMDSLRANATIFKVEENLLDEWMGDRELSVLKCAKEASDVTRDVVDQLRVKGLPPPGLKSWAAFDDTDPAAWDKIHRKVCSLERTRDAERAGDLDEMNRIFVWASLTELYQLRAILELVRVRSGGRVVLGADESAPAQESIQIHVTGNNIAEVARAEATAFKARYAELSTLFTASLPDLPSDSADELASLNANLQGLDIEIKNKWNSIMKLDLTKCDSEGLTFIGEVQSLHQLVLSRAFFLMGFARDSHPLHELRMLRDHCKFLSLRIKLLGSLCTAQMTNGTEDGLATWSAFLFGALTTYETQLGDVNSVTSEMLSDAENVVSSAAFLISIYERWCSCATKTTTSPLEDAIQKLRLPCRKVDMMKEVALARSGSYEKQNPAFRQWRSGRSLKRHTSKKHVDSDIHDTRPEPDATAAEAAAAALMEETDWMQVKPKKSTTKKKKKRGSLTPPSLTDSTSTMAAIEEGTVCHDGSVENNYTPEVSMEPGNNTTLHVPVADEAIQSLESSPSVQIQPDAENNAEWIEVSAKKSATRKNKKRESLIPSSLPNPIRTDVTVENGTACQDGLVENHDAEVRKEPCKDTTWPVPEPEEAIQSIESSPSVQIHMGAETNAECIEAKPKKCDAKKKRKGGSPPHPSLPNPTRMDVVVEEGTVCQDSFVENNDAEVPVEPCNGTTSSTPVAEEAIQSIESLPSAQIQPDAETNAEWIEANPKKSAAKKKKKRESRIPSTLPNPTRMDVTGEEGNVCQDGLVENYHRPEAPMDVAKDTTSSVPEPDEAVHSLESSPSAPIHMNAESNAEWIEAKPKKSGAKKKKIGGDRPFPSLPDHTTIDVAIEESTACRDVCMEHNDAEVPIEPAKDTTLLMPVAEEAVHLLESTPSTHIHTDAESNAEWIEAKVRKSTAKKKKKGDILFHPSLPNSIRMDVAVKEGDSCQDACVEHNDAEVPIEPGKDALAEHNDAEVPIEPGKDACVEHNDAEVPIEPGKDACVEHNDAEVPIEPGKDTTLSAPAAKEDTQSVERPPSTLVRTDAESNAQCIEANTRKSLVEKNTKNECGTARSVPDLSMTDAADQQKSEPEDLCAEGAVEHNMPRVPPELCKEDSPTMQADEALTPLTGNKGEVCVLLQTLNELQKKRKINGKNTTKWKHLQECYGVQMDATTHKASEQSPATTQKTTTIVIRGDDAHAVVACVEEIRSLAVDEHDISWGVHKALLENLRALGSPQETLDDIVCHMLDSGLKLNVKREEPRLFVTGSPQTRHLVPTFLDELDARFPTFTLHVRKAVWRPQLQALLDDNTEEHVVHRWCCNNRKVILFGSAEKANVVAKSLQERLDSLLEEEKRVAMEEKRASVEGEERIAMEKNKESVKEENPASAEDKRQKPHNERKLGYGNDRARRAQPSRSRRAAHATAPPADEQLSNNNSNGTHDFVGLVNGSKFPSSRGRRAVQATTPAVEEQPSHNSNGAHDFGGLVNGSMFPFPLMHGSYPIVVRGLTSSHVGTSPTGSISAAALQVLLSVTPLMTLLMRMPAQCPKLRPRLRALGHAADYFLQSCADPIALDISTILGFSLQGYNADTNPSFSHFMAWYLTALDQELLWADMEWPDGVNSPIRQIFCGDLNSIPFFVLNFFTHPSNGQDRDIGIETYLSPLRRAPPFLMLSASRVDPNERVAYGNYLEFPLIGGLMQPYTLQAIVDKNDVAYVKHWDVWFRLTDKVVQVAEGVVLSLRSEAVFFMYVDATRTPILARTDAQYWCVTAPQ